MNPRVKFAKVVTAFERLRRTMHYWRTCPNCKQQIDLESAIRRSGWSKLAPSNCGIRCPNCKMILAARQRGGYAAVWAVLAVVFAIEFLAIKTGHLTRTGMGLIGLGLLVFILFMQRWRLRSLIQLSLPPSGVDLREVLPSAKTYAYIEGKDGRDKAFRFDSATTEDPGPEWICSNCKHPNPASFELCWKCNHGRSARTS